MSYTGRCACGQVTVAVAGEPVTTRQCWCRQCRQIASGGPTHNAMFRTENVTITGEVKPHRYAAASGNEILQWFCPSCGSHVFAQSSARPHFRTIRFGIFDEPHGLKPRMAIWTDDAPAWAVIDPTLERHPRQPPAPSP
ncbi:MAG: GFA family protein [Novosphingobium sp.]|jgi:hypothetical protein|nr:GFA family protein [Novosphingobium sp.]